MNTKHRDILKPVCGLLFGMSLAAGSLAQSALENEYPELARLYDAFTVTHAAALDEVADINSNPRIAAERQDLRMELDMMKEMDHHQMMSMGHSAMGMSMSMDGPYGEFEADARAELGRMVRREYNAEQVSDAYANAQSLPRHAAMVLSWGAQFERDLWNIWADPEMSVEEKSGATEDAINEYQTGDAMHAISVRPKPASLYLDHEHANGMKTAFPRISGLLWSNQWLQLASLEAIILGQVDPQFAGRVDLTIERYNNKLGSETGMSVFPAPSELPTAPAIAPSLYTQSQQAAVILDNLNMLEAAIADIIAYPNLDADAREQAILEKVEQFTGEANADAEMDYLLSALRGGIFNQGGPAIGELSGSERNRSRAAMDMQHTMIMSGPN